MENLYFLPPLLTLCIFLIIRRFQNLNCRLPPSPVALPIIGHLHFLKTPLHQTLQTLSSKYGPVLYLWFGSRSAVIISSPSAFKECFTKNDVILANRPRTLAGDHLSYGYVALGFAPYGDLWRILRRATVVEVFSLNSVQKYSRLRVEEIARLCHRLYDLSSTGAEKVDLKYFSSLLTSNILMKMVTGRRLCEEMDSGNVEMEKKLLLEFKKTFYPTMSMTLCDFMPVLRLFGYRGIEKSMVRVQETRDEYLQDLINEVRLQEIDQSQKKTEQKASMIKTLLSLQESDPEIYSNNVIKSIILVMFTAGADSMAVAVEWALSLLLSHPDSLQQLRAEIDNLVGPTRMITDSDLAKLSYLQCVINEALRLYPAAPLLLPHFSSENCTVGGYDIPHGTMVLVNAWAIHRDPKVWEDPDKFKPERFITVSGEREGFRYIPFGAGRRACPGAAMGVRTVSLAVGALIQCFDWEKIGNEIDMGLIAGLTIAKAKPLEAMCYPRRSIQSNIFKISEYSI